MYLINKLIEFLRDRLWKGNDLSDILLIRQTGLFNEKDDDYLKNIPRKIKTFNKGKLIRPASGQLHIIKKGLVDIYPQDPKEGAARSSLGRGCFYVHGNNFLASRGYKARNGIAKVREDSMIIQIDLDLVSKNQHRFHHSTLQGVGFYKAIEKMIAQIPNQSIRHFAKGDLIFNKDDMAKAVYVILSGEVMIIIPEKGTLRYSRLILREGHSFGEVSVLENRPHLATAIAKSALSVLEIDKDTFVSYCLENSDLRTLYKSLHQLYQVPLKGTIHQYICNVEGIGTTVTNSYLLESGNQATSNAIVDKSIFEMSLNQVSSNKEYSFEKNEGQLNLYLLNDRIVKLTALGEWEELPLLCDMLLEGKPFIYSTLENLVPSKEKEMPFEEEIICTCTSLSRSKLHALIAGGVDNLESLARATGATKLCKKCENTILDMLGLRYWHQCELSRGFNSNSYLVKSLGDPFMSFKPGQCVRLQAEILGTWIEKPYFILNQKNEHELEIAVSKDSQDIFDRWLREKAQNGDIVEASQPEGDFAINPESKLKAFYFAEGLGVAPFLAFLKQMRHSQNSKRIHLLFRGSSKEIESVKREILDQDPPPCMTMTFKEFGNPNENWFHLLQYFSGAEIYICGSRQFVRQLKKGLRSIDYDANKIFSEVVLQ